MMIGERCCVAGAAAPWFWLPTRPTVGKVRRRTQTMRTGVIARMGASGRVRATLLGCMDP